MTSKSVINRNNKNAYVLITAALNEEDYIERIISSVSYELVKFRRTEQMQRLEKIFYKALKMGAQSYNDSFF